MTSAAGPPQGASAPSGGSAAAKAASEGAPCAGLILFAHGARDPRWAEPFAAVAERIRHADPARLVELAFLEMMAPDLAGATRRLVAAGAKRIDIVPMLLGTGGHLRKDLPPLVESVRLEHPRLDIRLHPAIGENQAVVAAMAEASLAMARLGE